MASTRDVCKAVDRETGARCGETGSLRILSEFQALYELRLEQIDQELGNEADRASMKLQLMRDWVRNLGEQNVMLVRTVEELEEAAASRVRLLEEKLHQSSMLVTDSISKSTYTEEAISRLSNRVTELERDESQLRRRIENLQSDIGGLLELLRRARASNDWSLDGISFVEVKLDDLAALGPGPVQGVLKGPDASDCDWSFTSGCACDQAAKVESLGAQLERLQENERKTLAYQAELEDKIARLSEDLLEKDQALRRYQSEFDGITDSVRRHTNLEDIELPPGLSKDSDNRVIRCLRKTRTILESEREALLEFKVHLERIFDRFRHENEEVQGGFGRNLDTLSKMLLEKDRSIDRVDSMMKSFEKCCNGSADTEIGMEEELDLRMRIAELEDSVKAQKETESSLKEHLLENEAELKRYKDLLNTLYSEHGVDGLLARCGCPHLKQEATNVAQLFKSIQNTVKWTMDGLQELENDLNRMVHDESASELIERLNKHKEDLRLSSQEIAKLKDTVYSKDKLLENMEEIVRIQKDSIAMTQSELKELHQRLQEKINSQDQVISQYKKEKGELLKQNELQIQTIGHLQNAVVEAKKCLDQMSQRSSNDLQLSTRTIRDLWIRVEETQSQYNDCFTEAAGQDRLLDLQRDSIRSLHERIRSIRLNHDLTIRSLTNFYHLVLTKLRGQLQARVEDFRALKRKVNELSQSRRYFEEKYFDTRKSLEEAEEMLRELRAASCKESTKLLQDKTSQTMLHPDDVQESACTKAQRGRLEERLESLKMILRERSDTMARLEADQAILKNENCILREEKSILEERLKEEASQFKRRLKETQCRLHNVEANHHRVSDDLEKTQHRLMEAARREIKLQEALTATEKEYSRKLMDSEREAARLEDLVECYAERSRVMEKQVENVARLEESNQCLMERLQNTVKENCTLVKEKAFMEEENRRVTGQLEEMHRSLIELDRQFESKDRSLACVTADLRAAAQSRSEICQESRLLLSSIGSWSKEQRAQLDQLAGRLATRREQLARLGFEKKALLAAVKELRRVNCLLTQRLRRSCRSRVGGRLCKGCHVVPSIATAEPNNTDYSYSSSAKGGSIGPIKTSRRTAAYGNPWWFPKMEYLTTELRRNNGWYQENLNDGLVLVDEARDYGYQSSTSK